MENRNEKSGTSGHDIVTERVLKAPVEKVWKAITDADQMKQWYFDLPGFRAEAGYEFSFLGGKDPAAPYMHLCKVIEVIPNKKLLHSWRYKGYAGDTLVSFELFPEGDKTRIRLTHSGLESFAVNNNPDLDAKNFAEGWTQIIGASLPGFVEK